VLALVIDDDYAVRQGMEVLLCKWNCEVITAAPAVRCSPRRWARDAFPISSFATTALRGEETGIAVVELLRNEFNSEVRHCWSPATRLGPIDPRSAVTCRCTQALNPARLRTLITNLLRESPLKERARRVS